MRVGINPMLKKLFLLFLLVWGVASAASLETTKQYQGEDLYDHYPWAVTYYYGYTVDNPLLRTVLLYGLKRWPENIQSLELAYTLPRGNMVREFFHPLVGVVEVAANVTLRNGIDEHRIVEFDPYIGFRWANLPWNNYVNTSFAIGEGVSYASSVPAVEWRANTNVRRFLNYVMLEATFALPSHPNLQMVARVHHRSGAFGLYQAGNSGSNVLGLGIRYLFD